MLILTLRTSRSKLLWRLRRQSKWSPWEFHRHLVCIRLRELWNLMIRSLWGRHRRSYIESGFFQNFKRYSDIRNRKYLLCNSFFIKNRANQLGTESSQIQFVVIVLMQLAVFLERLAKTHSNCLFSTPLSNHSSLFFEKTKPKLINWKSLA